MNREELFTLHKTLTSRALSLMEKKNADYGGNSDPFRNFHQFGLLGIIVRLSDKLARLQTFTERGELSVKDETVSDTILDVINYAVLFEGYRTKGDDLSLLNGAQKEEEKCASKDSGEKSKEVFLQSQSFLCPCLVCQEQRMRAGAFLVPPLPCD